MLRSLISPHPWRKLFGSLLALFVFAHKVYDRQSDQGSSLHLSMCSVSFSRVVVRQMSVFFSFLKLRTTGYLASICTSKLQSLLIGAFDVVPTGDGRDIDQICNAFDMGFARKHFDDLLQAFRFRNACGHNGAC